MGEKNPVEQPVTKLTLAMLVGTSIKHVQLPYVAFGAVKIDM